MGKKRKNLSKNLTKSRSIPYEDWVITENTHEAIISREIFFEVQRICMQELEKNRASRYCHSDIDSPDDIFAGLVYSGNTGLKMYRTRNYYEKHGMKYRYTTISQRDADYSKCSIISIKEEQIQETLVCLLKKQMELALELKSTLERLKVRFSPHNPYIRLLLEFYEGDFLSKDLLHRLVDKIYVYDSKTLEVVFKYRDEIEPILKFRESGVLQ